MNCMHKAISHKGTSHLGNQVKSDYWCILTGINRGLWLKTFRATVSIRHYELANTWKFLQETVHPAVVGQHLEVACWQISTTGRKASFAARGFYHPRDRKTRVQISNNGLTTIKQLLRGDYVITRKQHVRSLNLQESQIAGDGWWSEPSVCPASNMSTITGRTAIIFGTPKVPRGGNLFLMMSRFLSELFQLVGEKYFWFGYSYWIAFVVIVCMSGSSDTATLFFFYQFKYINIFIFSGIFCGFFFFSIWKVVSGWVWGFKYQSLVWVWKELQNGCILFISRKMCLTGTETLKMFRDSWSCLTAQGLRGRTQCQQKVFCADHSYLHIAVD